MYVLEVTPQRCGVVFSEHGEVVTDISLLKKSPEEIALVVFTGGEDVWPKLYGEKPIWDTYFNTQRDLYEKEIFEVAQGLNIPMVGICRGSQFLCAMAGGKLVQDIGGHTANHHLQTNDGRVIQCNSSHHQMQLPPANAVPLAWSEKRRSNRYLGGDGKMDVDREYEVVYYPNINAVGIQYHPEWLDDDHACVHYAKEVVNKYLFGKELEPK